MMTGVLNFTRYVKKITCGVLREQVYRVVVLR